MKTCFKCRDSKPFSEFYRHGQMSDGYLNKCKECTRKDVKANRRKRLDYYQEYDRKRGNRHQSGYLQRYRKSNAIKQQAHNRVNHALIAGRIQKPSACEECGGSEYGIHAHHDDYAQQLDVRWLCPSCHHQWHAEYGEARNSDMDPLPRGQFSAIKQGDHHGITL